MGHQSRTKRERKQARREVAAYLGQFMPGLTARDIQLAKARHGKPKPEAEESPPPT